MWNVLKNYLLYPLARFAFEFLGDHLWLLAVLVGLIAILVWRFCMPIIRGFYALFGWQGVALVAAAVATLGVFGAGWRAHRDAVLDPSSPEYHGNEPTKPSKPKRHTQPSKPTGEEDTVWYKWTHGLPVN
jgi:hypothetical protein